MNSRERVIRAVEFKYPDRIPVTHSYLQGAMLRHGEALAKIFRKYPSDFGPSDYSAQPPDPAEWKGRNYQRQWTDEWGCRWRERYQGIMGQVVGHPLEDWKALGSYKFPPLPKRTKEEFKKAKRDVEERKKKWYTGGGGGNLYERLQWLRGYENLMFDLMEGREEIGILADRLVDYNLKLIEMSLELGVDSIGFADDWGTQTQLMINPEMWREFFKPRYKRMFDLVHEAGAHVHFHSDGYIMEIISDLIEIGVDVLNPQFSCMDLHELADKFKGKVCFLMDLDRQYVLPFGTPEQVKVHVKQVIDILGMKEGGLIGRGEIGPDVPLANAEAMFEAFLEYGHLGADPWTFKGSGDRQD